MIRPETIGAFFLTVTFLFCLSLHMVLIPVHHHGTHTALAATVLNFEHFHDMTDVTFVALITVVAAVFFVFVFLEQFVLELGVAFVVKSEDSHRYRKRSLRNWLRLHFTSPPFSV